MRCRRPSTDYYSDLSRSFGLCVFHGREEGTAALSFGSPTQWDRWGRDPGRRVFDRWKCGSRNKISGNSLLVPAGTQAIKNWKFRPIKEKGQKAKGIAYIGFHFVPTDSKVFASFPLGKWEQTPAADPAGTEGANQPALVHIGRGTAAQKKIGGANPNYPQAAKRNHIEGPVELRAIIDREGHISLLEVMKTPSPDLAISAVEAVKTWQYKPYSLNGENLDVETEVVVNYELR